MFLAIQKSPYKLEELEVLFKSDLAVRLHIDTSRIEHVSIVRDAVLLTVLEDEQSKNKGGFDVEEKRLLEVVADSVTHLLFDFSHHSRISLMKLYPVSMGFLNHLMSLSHDPESGSRIFSKISKRSLDNQLRSSNANQPIYSGSEFTAQQPDNGPSQNGGAPAFGNDVGHSLIETLTHLIPSFNIDEVKVSLVIFWLWQYSHLHTLPMYCGLLNVALCNEFPEHSLFAQY